MSNGRQWAMNSSGMFICTVKSSPHVQWKSLHSCSMWTYVMSIGHLIFTPGKCFGFFDRIQHAKLIEMY